MQSSPGNASKPMSEMDASMMVLDGEISDLEQQLLQLESRLNSVLADPPPATPAPIAGGSDQVRHSFRIRGRAERISRMGGNVRSIISRLEV